MNDAVVSVITPTKGRPEALRRAMASVRDQTASTVEHIVLGDNCPHLARKEVRDALVHEFPQARVLNLAPTVSGLAYRPARTALVRNHGLAMATGRFVAHLDDDNAFTPDHLATLVATLEAKPHAVAAHSWRHLIYADGRPYVPDGRNPWIADPEESARNYDDLADSGVFEVDSNVMRDRVWGRHGQRYLLVDVSELMVRADFHVNHPFRTDFRDYEMRAGLCEDRAWCAAVVGAGHDIEMSERATLLYTMGGYSNGPDGPSLWALPDGDRV